MGKTSALRDYLEIREPRVLALDPFDDFPALELVEWNQALRDLAKGGPCRRRVKPDPGMTSREWAALFFKACLDHVENVLLVLDELTKWTNVQVRSPFLEELILQGRHHRIRIAAACQRLALVPTEMRAELTELVIFRVSMPQDLDAIADWGGGELRERCSKLQRDQCVVLTGL